MTGTQVSATLRKRNYFSSKGNKLADYKKRKPKHIQALFRTLRGLSLKHVEELTGHLDTTISTHENFKTVPEVRTINNISKALDINPTVLYYSFGLIPDKIKEMIKSDPFYYMEKMEKLYYNHDKRYGKEDFDLDKLNMVRVFEYTMKGNKSEKS